MLRMHYIQRGLALGPALVLLLAACAPAPAPAPAPGSFDDAAAALSRADAPALRKALGLGPGLAARAAELASRLDPRAWLVVMGASWREHDLAACARAMQARDDAALNAAIGIGEQALAAEILQAGRTVYTRRTGGMDYYHNSAAPLTLLAPALAPATSAGVEGYELTAWGRADDRVCRVRVGRNRRGMSNLSAAADPALDGPARPRSSARFDTPANAAAGVSQALPPLDETHWMGLEARIVLADGGMETLRLGRDEGGWYLVERNRQSLAERLESERDRRLDLLRRTAAGLLQASGRWPRDESQITLRPVDYTDPASGPGRLGWADHDATPPRGIRLAQPQTGTDVAAECLEPVQGRRRVITRDGVLGWAPGG